MTYVMDLLKDFVGEALTRTYREKMSRYDKNWVESVYITKAEYGGNFGTAYQTLNKIYSPVAVTADAGTLTTSAYTGFTGDMNSLYEVKITTAGGVDVSHFEWRKKTFFGRVWSSYTDGGTATSAVALTDGITLDFTEVAGNTGDVFLVQACGSWHTPASGRNSYLTSIVMFPFDESRNAKAGAVRTWCGDFRVVDYVSKKVEFLDWRTPIHLLGDGSAQFKAQMAELSAGDINEVSVVLKGWDD